MSMDREMEYQEFDVVVIDADEQVLREYLVSARSEEEAFDNWMNPRFSSPQLSRVSYSSVSEVIVRPSL